MPASFDPGNNILVKIPNNNINKGRWTPEEHKIFIEEYEKYGNNCMLIAKVLRSQTPAQIKKHAECFFKQNLKTTSAAVKQYWETLTPNKKEKVLVNDTDAHRKQCKSFPPEKKIKFLETNADAHKKKQESLSPENKDLINKNNTAAQHKYRNSLSFNQKLKY
jgi:hypothetical protein